MLLSSGLTDLTTLLHEDENTISAYELYSSGLIQCFLKLFASSPNSKSQRKMYESRMAVCRQVLTDNTTKKLVKKLISVLETIEKLPVYQYDQFNGGHGLQLLTRRFRFRLERDPEESAGSLIDRTGRTLKMEPLATVKQLERFLVKMVAKQWYDYDRPTFNFVKHAAKVGTITFTYQSDFDENGLMYWIGTNGRTSVEWVNPAQYALVTVTSSEGRNLPYGRLEVRFTQYNNYNIRILGEKKRSSGFHRVLQ